jgi:PTH1 family peptidyl-tRNA hydrolase
MLLIVGLGNYPSEYEKTRHNIGFMAVEKLVAQKTFAPWKLEKKFFGKITTGEIKGEKAIFCKPETFMNLSGKSVSALATFYKIPPEKIWILYDDVDTNFGEIRYREKGSSGGHNGIKSLISSLGTDIFPRIKFGIKNELFEKIPTEAFVLQKFSKEELSQLPEIMEKGIEKFLQEAE